MFNVESTVLNSLGTVQDQTYENIEIICVDDGSTDRTVELVKGFSNDPRIRIVSQENRGLGGARNTGIREAKGEWLTFVDSDDWIHPTMVEELVSEAMQDPELDIVDCLHAVVDENGVVVATRERSIATGDPDYFAEVMSGTAPALACGKIYRTSLFDDNELLFPEHTIHEDIYVTYKMFYNARRAKTVTKFLYVWNHRLGSLSRSISRKHVDDTMRAFDSSWEFLTRKGVSDLYIDQFYLRCAHFTLGLFNKAHVYASDSRHGRDALRYLKEKLRGSPYFSNKMRSSLRSSHPKVLSRLIKEGILSPVIQPGNANQKRGVSGTRGGDPLYYVTFAGLLLMTYRKLKRLLARGRAGEGRAKTRGTQR